MKRRLQCRSIDPILAAIAIDKDKGSQCALKWAIEDTDVAKAIVEFVWQTAVEKLVVGAPSKGGFVR